ncbi:MAG: hypothetical protein IJ874_03455 [Ruminococcus sp.]|nr:hypothetical protein [Ruminococcus sp.]
MRILKYNGEPVLNYLDISPMNSPVQMLEQLDLFMTFARIHCVPVPSWFRDDSGAVCRAKCFTKQFWAELIDIPAVPGISLAEPLSGCS